MKSPKELAQEIVDRYSADNPATKSMYAMASHLLKLEEENEQLKKRFCSHGDYQVWGTSDCNGCDDGPITLYYLSGLCVECQHKALSRVTGEK